MNVKGWRGKGRPKIIRIDSVKQNERDENDEMNSGREEWDRNT
jgi:hypothetical protein